MMSEASNVTAAAERASFNLQINYFIITEIKNNKRNIVMLGLRRIVT